MTEAAQLDERVTRLELEMAEVRYLATRANKDVSDFKTVLVGHTSVINAIREDQVEQGKRLARVEQKVENVEQKVGAVETEMRSGFAMLAQGQERITDLITQHIEECDRG